MTGTGAEGVARQASRKVTPALPASSEATRAWPRQSGLRPGWGSEGGPGGEGEWGSSLSATAPLFVCLSARCGEFPLVTIDQPSTQCGFATPSELRSCPEVAPTLSKTRSTVAPGAELRPAESGRVGPSSGQCWPRFCNTSDRCENRGADTLAHYVLCPRICEWIGAAAFCACKEMSARALLGFAVTPVEGPSVPGESAAHGDRESGLPPVARGVARRREPASSAHSGHVQAGARIMHEIATAVRAGRAGCAFFRRAPPSRRARDGDG